MAEHVVADKLVISGKQNFTHNFALIAIVFKGTHCSKIIKNNKEEAE